MSAFTRILATGGEPNGRILWRYVAGSLALVAMYPFLPVTARPYAFALTAIAATFAVGVGMRAVRPGRRLPWWLLMGALTLLVAGLLLYAINGARPTVVGMSLNAAGNVVLLAAAIALVIRCGKRDIGGILDASIVGLAVGGLLWSTVMHLSPPPSMTAAVNRFVVLFALSGVLGALARIARVVAQPVEAVWWLLVGLSLALVANVIRALFDGGPSQVAASMMFMAAYTAVGAFGLHPASPRLVKPGFVVRDDTLSHGQLAFLGIAVAVVPVTTGVRIIMTDSRLQDGALLVASALCITALVMVRIGRLSAERSRIEQALRHEVTVDALTGLSNRRAFLDRLTGELAHHRRCTVLFCDLDGFKAINDRWGHDAGDELLTQVGSRLAACVRESDLVARFGGDEFLILLVGASQAGVDTVVERIDAAFAIPYHLAAATVTLGVSVGVADAADGDPDRLVRRADSFMYQAKRTQEPSPSVRVAA